MYLFILENIKKEAWFCFIYYDYYVRPLVHIIRRELTRYYKIGYDHQSVASKLQH